VKALGSSRREALAVLLGAGGLLPVVFAGETGPSIRFAVSESMLGDVNINDARVATQFWIKRISADANIAVDPKVFSSTQEIADRIRSNELDVVALNTLEYRQLASLLDPSQIVTSTSGDGVEQYLILARKNGAAKHVGDLQGRRLALLKNNKMCLAPAWLSCLLDAGHYGAPERFFASISADAKVSRVILPVFFGQIDCCLTSKHAFSTMCEMNPQLGRELEIVAASPPVIVGFYVFRKNYPNALKEKLLNGILHLCNGAGGNELAELFQFGKLRVMDAGSLTSAMNILEQADRARARQGGGRR
jgi:phosphonate transport system substrate-binding protein